MSTPLEEQRNDAELGSDMVVVLAALDVSFPGSGPVGQDQDEQVSVLL